MQKSEGGGEIVGLTGGVLGQVGGAALGGAGGVGLPLGEGVGPLPHRLRGLVLQQIGGGVGRSLAARAEVAGLIAEVGELTAELSGLGGLDAQQFVADAVTLELSGLGNATITAHQSANLNLSGMGSVTVYGKPLNRRVSVDGLGKVSWK